MRKTVAGFWWSPAMEGTPALIVTAAFFTLGGLLGYLGVFQFISDSSILAGYLERFVRAVEANDLWIPHFTLLFWREIRWPVLTFLFGFTALGLFVLPVLSCLRGFFFSFSIAAFAYIYGRTGLYLAFLLLGLPGFITIPCFFLLTTQSFTASQELACRSGNQGKRELPYQRDYFLRCGLCCGILCVSLLLERYIIPILISGMTNSLLQ